MSAADYVRFVGALILVLGLIGAAALALRRFGVAGTVGPLARGRRLGIVETLALDTRHRLVLVRRDDVEHLILIGQTGQTVVESTIRLASRVTPAEEPRQ
jgi:flagellar protein FliO/FliZ